MLPYEANRATQKTPVAVISAEERIKGFDEVIGAYTKEQAVNEARRCLQCMKAPCMQGCCIKVPIPDFLAAVAKEDFAEAYRLITEVNVLPGITGRVCFTDEQCEGHCIRKVTGDGVAIGKVQRFVADWAKENAVNIAPADPDEQKRLAGKRIACVGSGPSAVVCAHELASMGASVVMFEANEQTGGQLRYGIPTFRLPDEILDYEYRLLDNKNITVVLNTTIGQDKTLVSLLKEEGFDAIYVASGADKPNMLGIEGENLKGVITSSEFLTAVNTLQVDSLKGKRCVVIGGGDVAMDSARCALRLGAEVDIVYRRSLEEMPAHAIERIFAEEEGVGFKYLYNPVAVVSDENGEVCGIKCDPCVLSEPDESGRRAPISSGKPHEVIPCETVVLAIGNGTNTVVAQSVPELDMTKRGLIIINEETAMTSVARIFAGGDAVDGPSTVLSAMQAGRLAAQGIAEYLAKM